MTGFSEAELVGRLPPFPYWPPDRIDENSRLLQQELQGRSPAGGIEVQGDAQGRRAVRRPHVRLPADRPQGPADRLDDEHHQHHRGQAHPRPALGLARALHHRARRPGRVGLGAVGAAGRTAVRQPLATGCGSAPTRAATRCWPAAQPAPPFDAPTDDDVDNLSGLPTQELTEAGANPREVYVESLKKWFDVRSRYLQWTDGRLAQMLIATDITARLRAEEQAAQQAEKAQVTSRLVTMGEMASSVAHELNQPLTAITNYCNGMVSRVKADSIQKDDLIAALQKTARQAERAGQIIHRIRAFVKTQRAAAPARAGARRSSTTRSSSPASSCADATWPIHTYVAQRLPTLMVDPILIEQVRAEPAEERRRGDRQRAAAAGAPPHRAARGAAPHARRRRCHRVQRHRHGPGPEGRSDRPPVRGLLLHQGRGPGHRAVAVPLDRRVAPRPDAGAEPLQWQRPSSGCRFAFTLPVESAGRAATLRQPRRPKRRPPQPEPHRHRPP